MQQRYSAEIGSRDKSGYVTDYSPADGKQQRLSVGSRMDEFAANRFHRAYILSRFGVVH